MKNLMLSAVALSAASVAAGTAIAPLLAAPQSAAFGTVSRDFMMSSIVNLTLEGDIAATLTHDPRAALVATGQPTDIDRLNIQRNGSSLRISMAQSGASYQRKGPVTIAIKSADVKSLSLNGGASLTADRLDQQQLTLGVFGSGALAVGTVKADKLRINMRGSGAIALGSGAVSKADFVLDGAGRLDAGAMTIGDLTITSSGPNSIAAQANSTAEVKAYGAGSITIGGRAPCRVPYAAQASVECKGGVAAR